jgi:hypothetical protein
MRRLRALYRNMRATFDDWRTRAILYSWVLSVGLTADVYLRGIWQDPVSHLGAVFAAWVGGLALFTIVGAITAVVSLAQPQHDSFDSRARILFRGQSGAHIDYVISTLRNLFEHYAETMRVEFCVCSYQEGDAAAAGFFRLEEKTTFKFRSYIDDIVSTYKAALEYSEVTPAPKGGTANKLALVRIDGVQQGKSRTFTDRLQEPISATIQPGSECDMEIKVEYWVRDGEANDFIPVRYTKKLILEIENQLVSDSVSIILLRDGEGEGKPFQLLSGGERKSFEFRDLPPGNRAYTFIVNTVAAR